MFKNITETVVNLKDKKVERVSTSLIFYATCLVIFIGLYFVIEGMQITDAKTLLIGVFLLLIIAPFMLLYPVVRFLIGGRDSLLGFSLTLLVEHVIGKKIIKHVKAENRK
jgi:hypothetical protein